VIYLVGEGVEGVLKNAELEIELTSETCSSSSTLKGASLGDAIEMDLLCLCLYTGVEAELCSLSEDMLSLSANLDKVDGALNSSVLEYSS
jgi:hypothetical protein